MSKTIVTTIGLVLLLAFVAIFGLTGCEKTVTVTEVKTEHDTLIVEVPKGPAYIRFISLLPDPGATDIILRRGPSELSAPFALVQNQSKNEFIPVPERTAMQVYAFYTVNGVKTLDSITLPPLDPTQLYTCAIFRIDDTQEGTSKLFPRFGWDSTKLSPASDGMAYLRFINGVADYPNPNHVNLVLKDEAGSPIYDAPVSFSQMVNYVQVPVGNYKVFVKSPDESAALYQKIQNFVQGGYYTAYITGQRSMGTDNFNITAEN